MNVGQRVMTLPINNALIEQALAKIANYRWLFEGGMFFFLLATLGIAIWIFFDSTNKNKGSKALVPRILSMVGVFLICPAFIFRYTGNADGVTLLVRMAAEPGQPNYPGAINWNVRWLVNGYGPMIALIALLGVIVSVVGIIIYASTVQRSRPSTEFMGALNSKFGELSGEIGKLKAAGSTGSSPATIGPAGAPSGGAATIIDRRPAAATIIDRPVQQSGATLQAISGAEDGRSWNLPASDVKIGRDASSFVVIADGKASREHAKLMYNQGDWHVIDLGSANGTYLNNNTVTGQQALASGDVIRIGDTSFVFNK